jgi:biotin carboxyl carrier protein
MKHLTARPTGKATAGNLRHWIACCIVRPMGKSTKRITRNTDRPARRASRSTTEAAPPAPTSGTPAETAEPTVAPVAESTAGVELAAVAPVHAPTHGQVARLAFRYFAESGHVHGQALDHWLRAEAELTRA